MALVNMWDEPRDIEGVNVTYEQPAEFPSGDVPLTIATASLNKLVERVTDDKSHGTALVVRSQAGRGIDADRRPFFVGGGAMQTSTF